jgi:hypothetical protein
VPFDVSFREATDIRLFFTLVYRNMSSWLETGFDWADIPVIKLVTG